MNKDFKISNREYSFLIKYFNLIENKKLLHIANIRIENYVNNNSVKYIDFFLNSCLKYYFDIFFLDFLSKFFFRKSIIRLKLNLVLALQEADYDNFNHMIETTNIKVAIFDILKYSIISVTFPIWLIYKFFIFKLILKKQNV
ncbi:hypothetical protein IDG99_00820 [Pelagibacterales bacterium SAG-MED09]|nr:hypothetical protein [Pelagibacterales bacterium SAG-MED09]